MYIKYSIDGIFYNEIELFSVNSPPPPHPTLGVYDFLWTKRTEQWLPQSYKHFTIYSVKAVDSISKIEINDIIKFIPAKMVAMQLETNNYFQIGINRGLNFNNDSDIINGCGHTEDPNNYNIVDYDRNYNNLLEIPISNSVDKKLQITVTRAGEMQAYTYNLVLQTTLDGFHFFNIEYRPLGGQGEAQTIEFLNPNVENLRLTFNSITPPNLPTTGKFTASKPNNMNIKFRVATRIYNSQNLGQIDFPDISGQLFYPTDNTFTSEESILFIYFPTNVMNLIILQRSDDNGPWYDVASKFESRRCAVYSNIKFTFRDFTIPVLNIQNILYPNYNNNKDNGYFMNYTKSLCNTNIIWNFKNFIKNDDNGNKIKLLNPNFYNKSELPSTNKIKYAFRFGINNLNYNSVPDINYSNIILIIEENENLMPELYIILQQPINVACTLVIQRADNVDPTNVDSFYFQMVCKSFIENNRNILSIYCPPGSLEVDNVLTVELHSNIPPPPTLPPPTLPPPTSNFWTYVIIFTFTFIFFLLIMLIKV